MRTESLHVVIIGAGYGGLVLAHALGRAGVSCAVYEAQPGRAGPSVSGQPLRQLLLTGVGDRVHFGKQFTRYERQAGGTVTAVFTDGSTVSGQLLVAADGADSAVRAQYLPQVLTELRPAWRSSNITLVGDAIHPVTAGQRAGANTAVRDALLLGHAIAAVQGGRVSLLNAIAAYESELMRAGSPRARGPLASRATAGGDPAHPVHVAARWGAKQAPVLMDFLD
jgi:2-polyprenyl-6-methoxyphenol hydroxylase-like FAD-dependent oxidoreductase